MTYCGVDHTIYIHTNIIDGKVYIGQTCQKDLTRRWCGGHGYKGCDYFINAIKKYGWNGFTHEILETGLTQEQANEREIYYISLYNSANPKYGYNIRSGGMEHSEISPEGIKRLQERFSGAKNPIARAVRIYDCEGNFLIECETVSEAATYLNCAKSSIVQVCKGERGTAKNHLLFYKDNIPAYKHLPPQLIIKPRNMSRRFKQVNQYSLDGKFIKTFQSIKSANQECHIVAGEISEACNGKFKSAGGYMWRYYDGITSDIEPYQRKDISGENHYTKKRFNNAQIQ